MKKIDIKSRLFLPGLSAAIIFILLLSVIWFFVERQDRPGAVTSRAQLQRGLSLLPTLNNPSTVQQIKGFFHPGEFAGSVAFSHNQAGLNMVTVRQGIVTGGNTLLSIFGRILPGIFIMILFSFLMAMVFTKFMIRRRINQSLDQALKLMDSGSTESLRLLRLLPDGFGQLSVFLDKYIQQKEELLTAKAMTEVSDSLKSEFLRNISHEIRTPMSSIIGFSRLLGNPDLSGDEKSQYANIVIQNTEQLLRTVEDILEISGLETKQIRIQNTKTDLSELLSDLHQGFIQKANEKNISLRIRNEIPVSQGNILVDHSKLLKVLEKLVGNALKFTKSGFVEIGCKIAEGKVLFHVQDSGIGIEKGLIHKIFERFSQADGTHSRKFDGLGLGLSIASEYIKLLGGKISVESNPGYGSVFSFFIPYRPASEMDLVSIKSLNGNTKTPVSRAVFSSTGAEC